MGFTLVELLVVISIIAILASLLLPALKRARDTSKGMVCLGNLRTVGMAQAGYSENNSGWIVLQQTGEANESWFQMLAGVKAGQQNYGVSYNKRKPYDAAGTFACPSERTPWGSYKDVPSKFNYTHYGVNSNTCGFIAEGVVYIVPRRIGNINRPSVAVFAADTNTRQEQSVSDIYRLAHRHGADDPRPSNAWEDAYATYPLSAFRGRANVLYFDGHVASRAIAELYAQPDDTGSTSKSSFLKAGIRQ